MQNNLWTNHWPLTIVWYLHLSLNQESWTHGCAEQKNLSLQHLFCIYFHNRNDWFLDCIVTCDEKWIQYDNSTAHSGWIEVSKHFLKEKLYEKKFCLVIGKQNHPLQLLGSEGNYYSREIHKMHPKL